MVVSSRATKQLGAFKIRDKIRNDWRRYIGLGIAVGSSGLLLGLAYWDPFGIPSDFDPYEVEDPYPESLEPPPSSYPRPAESDLVSPHFTLGQFASPARYGVPRVPYPTGWILPRLKPLLRELEKLRDALGGHPMRVGATGAYRTPALNAEMRKRSPNVALHSQHMLGRAADIKVSGVSATVVWSTALAMVESGALDIHGLGRYPTFCHIDIRPVAGLTQWTR